MPVADAGGSHPVKEVPWQPFLLIHTFALFGGDLHRTTNEFNLEPPPTVLNSIKPLTTTAEPSRSKDQSRAPAVPTGYEVGGIPIVAHLLEENQVERRHPSS